MNNAYEIIECKDNQYSCIVIPTSCFNPLDKIDVLLVQLRDKKVRAGRILFDFIISSGNTRERYASVQYNDGFVNNSFQYVDVKKNDPVRKDSSDFLRTEVEYINQSILNSSQITLLKAGYDL